MKKRYRVMLTALLIIVAAMPRYPHGMAVFHAVQGGGVPLATAINIYARLGTKPNVIFRQGVFDGVPYTALWVYPDANTEVVLDYAGETPKPLEKLAHFKLGWWRVGGINAGFFIDHGEAYGRPVGAVAIDGKFQTWKGETLVPAYGKGNVTAYFDEDGSLALAYHGWKDGQWCPAGDSFGTYDAAKETYTYRLKTPFAVSGGYSLLRNGKRVWLGKGHSPYWESSTKTGVTCFGQCQDGSVLLVVAGALGGGEEETRLMRQLGAMTALRMDGGASGALCVDRLLLLYTRRGQDVLY